MKVIKEGKWNLPWTAQMSCPTCEAILLVEEKDVKPVDYSSGDFCMCMLCGKSIAIHAKDLAQRVREAEMTSASSAARTIAATDSEMKTPREIAGSFSFSVRSPRSRAA